MSIGVLLCNVGTPSATDLASISKYLREFMSDRRVIDRSGLWWNFLLNAVIIPRRAPMSAAAYQAIWNRETNESPLRSYTRSQASQLQEELAELSSIKVSWAMRYGSPSIDQTIGELFDARCDRLLVVPLYPQYSGATIGSMMDAVNAALADLQSPPALRVLPPYYADGAYNDALEHSISDHHASLGWAPEATLFSFHGLPQAFIDRGDPYQAQCETTVRNLRETLRGDDQNMPLVYQSRGGRGKWIGPDLEDTLVSMAQSGVQRVTVVTPGFVSDCVETLEEVAIRAREAFQSSGGREFSHVPCLNDSPTCSKMISVLVRRELSGWA